MLFEKIQLEPGEEVLTVVRKHWFIIATELFVTFVVLLIPFFVLFAFALFPSKFLIIDISIANYTSLIAFAIATWSILSLMAGFATWTHYYLDLWIVTDRRIILIDQVRFFNRNVSMFRLERLQDIEFFVKGVIPTLLNFGTLKAQTAGAFESNFKTDGLPDPRGLQATIQKAMDQRLARLHHNPELEQ
jgi:hypothetical protein